MNKIEQAGTHLIQECAEVQKAVTKFLMFGGKPTFQGKTYDNIHDILEELGDLRIRAEEFLDLIETSPKGSFYNP